jgi:hypothetical protein
LSRGLVSEELEGRREEWKCPTPCAFSAQSNSLGTGNTQRPRPTRPSTLRAHAAGPRRLRAAIADPRRYAPTQQAADPLRAHATSPRPATCRHNRLRRTLAGGQTPVPRITTEYTGFHGEKIRLVTKTPRYSVPSVVSLLPRPRPTRLSTLRIHATGPRPATRLHTRPPTLRAHAATPRSATRSRSRPSTATPWQTGPRRYAPTQQSTDPLRAYATSPRPATRRHSRPRRTLVGGQTPRPKNIHGVLALKRLGVTRRNFSLAPVSVH